MSRKARREKRELEKLLAKRGQSLAEGERLYPQSFDERARQIIAEDAGKRYLPAHYGGTPRVNGEEHHGGVAGFVYPWQPTVRVAESEVWRCDSTDITKPCPIAKVPKVWMASRMYDEWISLAEDNETEWLAYLLGKYDEEKRRWQIEKMYFPPQVATGGHVDIPEGYQTKIGTIGAVHSHVGMAVFFSGEDMAHSNWPVEIVINQAGEHKCMVRYKLECGKYAKGESEVWLEGPHASDNSTRALERAFELGKEMRNANTSVGRNYVPITVSDRGHDGEQAVKVSPVDSGDTGYHPTGDTTASGQSAEDAAIEASLGEDCDACGGTGIAMTSGVEQFCVDCGGYGFISREKIAERNRLMNGDVDNRLFD